VNDPRVDLNAQDKNGWTPLMWAVFFNDEYVVRELLNRGADINACDDNGESVLHLLVRYGSQDRWHLTDILLYEHLQQ